MQALAGNKVVVTGGGGFVGRALCQRLIEAGVQVSSIARGDYPELRRLGVKCFKEDLSRPSKAFLDIFQSATAVFHTAAKVDMWGRYRDFYAVNVEGTKNVIAACQAQSVKCLVFTSSPSVIARGTDLRGVDESLPYPERYNAYYPQTKAAAEQLVLASNSASLFTCALRPHLIWGPGDTNLIPTVLARARAGRLVKIGSGNNQVDFSYIDDCVQAHMCACEALLKNPEARGLAYFISQGDPLGLWDWIDRILQIHGLDAVKRSINPKLAGVLATILETGARIIPGFTPLLTRFLVEEMATDHYFNINRAKKLLGYQPAYTMQQAFERYAGSAQLAVNL